MMEHVTGFLRTHKPIRLVLASIIAPPLGILLPFLLFLPIAFSSYAGLMLWLFPLMFIYKILWFGWPLMAFLGLPAHFLIVHYKLRSSAVYIWSGALIGGLAGVFCLNPQLLQGEIDPLFQQVTVLWFLFPAMIIGMSTGMVFYLIRGRAKSFETSLVMPDLPPGVSKIQ